MDTLLNFFSIGELIVLLFLGCMTFLATALDDWLNDKKLLRKFPWYLQEFIYTILSIVIGLSACLAMETSKGVTWLVAMLMGLIGSTLIRKVKLRQDSLAEGIVDSVEHRIQSTIETSTKEITYAPAPPPLYEQNVTNIPGIANPTDIINATAKLYGSVANGNTTAQLNSTDTLTKEVSD